MPPPKGIPLIDHTGTMIIPFNADLEYHYWNGGQPLSETLLELDASKDIWGKLNPFKDEIFADSKAYKQVIVENR